LATASSQTSVQIAPILPVEIYVQESTYKLKI